jgi:hypothetical protein
MRVFPFVYRFIGSAKTRKVSLLVCIAHSRSARTSGSWVWWPGGDAAGDDQLTDVDGLLGHGGVQHGGVSALAGEGDGGAGDLRVRSGAAAAVDEQHGPSTQRAHAGQDVADGGEGTVDGELDGAGEVGDRRVEDRVHELGLRDGAVLKHLDRAQVVRGLVQRTGECLRVADAGGVPAGGEPGRSQIGREGVNAVLAAGDDGDVEAFGAEAAGDCRAESGTGADDGEGGHAEVPPTSCVGAW